MKKKFFFNVMITVHIGNNIKHVTCFYCEHQLLSSCQSVFCCQRRKYILSRKSLSHQLFLKTLKKAYFPTTAGRPHRLLAKLQHEFFLATCRLFTDQKRRTVNARNRAPALFFWFSLAVLFFTHFHRRRHLFAALLSFCLTSSVKIAHTH